MEKLRSKLVCFTKPLKLSDNNKDTLAYYATELIMTVMVFIIRDPVQLNVTDP
jgi:hypothetical protein